MQSFALFLSIFSLFFACKSGPRHSTPGTPVTAPPTSAAIDTIHYFDLAPTQTPFDATKLQSVDYTLSAVQQGSQTGIHISIATPLDPNSDFFRMSVCTDSSCSDPQRIQQEFAPAIWDYYPAPDLQGVLTVEVQACIDPARAKDPAVTCGPIQTKVWKQVANPDDAAAKSMQTFQAERSGFQSDCEQARTLVNTYLQANPTPPTAPEALRFYNLAKNFSFMDPHACASLIRSGELWTIDAALQQNGTTPAASQSLELADTTPSNKNTFIFGAVAASAISILCFVGATTAFLDAKKTGFATISGNTTTSAPVRVAAEISPELLAVEQKLATTEVFESKTKAEISTIQKRTAQIQQQLSELSAEVVRKKLAVEAFKGELEAIVKNSALTPDVMEKQMETVLKKQGIEPEFDIERKTELTPETLKQDIEVYRAEANKPINTLEEKIKNLEKQIATDRNTLMDKTNVLNQQEAKVGEMKAEKAKQAETDRLKRLAGQLETTAKSAKTQTKISKGAIAGTVFGIVFAAAAVVIGVLSTTQLAADTAPNSQQALVDQFATLRTQIDARMDRYLAAYVHEVETN